MPEGHTIHRLADAHRDRFAGHPVRAASPQGRFADGAALVDGHVLSTAEAHGKHLFLGFPGFPGSGDDPRWIHVHLGLFGTYAVGDGPAPPATGTVRLRLVRADDGAWSDLRGPTACALLTDGDKKAVHDRLGPDPLRSGTDPEPAWRRVSRSRSAIATLLMDQQVVAGVGNVYRAEVLFRHHVDPYRAGRDLDRATFDALWADLVTLMREGVRLGRIDTVRPEHTPEAMGRPPRVDDHGGEVYVYRRAGLPCLLCGSEVRTANLGNRNLFWCPACQRP